MIKFQGLTDSALFVNLIKLRTFKQFSSLQAIGELMASSNHYINIQLAKFISSCFDLRNILLANQTNATRLLYHNIII